MMVRLPLLHSLQVRCKQPHAFPCTCKQMQIEDGLQGALHRLCLQFHATDLKALRSQALS